MDRIAIGHMPGQTANPRDPYEYGERPRSAGRRVCHRVAGVDKQTRILETEADIAGVLSDCPGDNLQGLSGLEPNRLARPQVHTADRRAGSSWQSPSETFLNRKRELPKINGP